MNSKFIISFILSLATGLLVGCGSGESKIESSPIASPDRSVALQEEVALALSNPDTVIVDDEWIYQLIDLVEAKSFNLKPDSIRLIKNLHLPGVIDTLRFVGTEGFSAMIYSVSNDSRQILWESTIILDSEFGRKLWRDLSTRHSIRSNTCTRVLDFEATNEVRIFCENDGVDRFIYCSLHRE
jgi:hypothetical protein